MRALTEHQKLKDIPEKIEEFLTARATTAAEVGRMAGVGESYMSIIINRKLQHGKTLIADKYYYNICRAIGYDINATHWKHFDTLNYMQIIRCIDTVRYQKKRLAIDGDTGAGKSYACKRYRQEIPSETYVVTCSALENGKEFAINIAETVGVETHGTSSRIIQRVIRKLLKNTQNPILIIDEAEHIGKKQGYINVIKALADALEDKVGMVLIGMGINDILQRSYDRHKQVFRQTARRFGEREICEKEIQNDIKNICDALGITGERVQRWLIDRIDNFGDLKVIITKALEQVQKNGEELNLRLFKSLWGANYMGHAA